MATDEEIRALQDLLSQRDAEIRDLKQEKAQLESQIKIQQLEITNLSMVVERDLNRVKAELAVQAARIALANHQTGKIQRGEEIV